VLRRPRLLTVAATLAVAALPAVAGARTPPLPPLLAAGATTRMSVSSTGEQGRAVTGPAAPLDGLSGALAPSVSPDGRYVAFVAFADGLTPRCGPEAKYSRGKDLYLRDRKTGRTELVSVLRNGCPERNFASLADASPPSVSAGGRCVAYVGYGEPVPENSVGGTQVYVRDRLRRRTTLVSVAFDGTRLNEKAERPVISADCRYVAFQSPATNVLRDQTGDKRTGASDAYVRDLRTGRVERVGRRVRPGGWDKHLMSMTPDGRYVTFVCASPDLWSGYGFGNVVPTTYLSGNDEVYVYDRRTGTTAIASLADDGHMANHFQLYEWPANDISADGRYIVFATASTNLEPVGNDGPPGGIFFQDLSFDVYVRDMVARQTTRVSAGPGGIPGNWHSVQPAISADGRWIAFSSGAADLGDADATPLASLNRPDMDHYNKGGAFDVYGYDLYLYDRVNATNRLISRATDGTQGNDISLQPSVSADGSVVAYVSRATNLVPGDTNDLLDVFVYERAKTG
jgi:Tol biopolymer transport system component